MTRLGWSERTHEIAEHHRELAALSCIRARRGRCGWGSRSSSGLPNRLSAAAAKLRRGLVLEPAGWAWRGQRRPALRAKSPGRRIFGLAARAAQFGAPLGRANQSGSTIPETWLSKKLRAERRTLGCTSRPKALVRHRIKAGSAGGELRGHSGERSSD
jgi:hypothetical protein